ncbi:Mu transposase C-terminal domain-containing protein [Mycobacteroides abscessus]|uniref:Mu transposase C-terminal domain-containing protein n=1 Tax=Mycobacteroides abscessus TaxID=36809 RepID=UPI000E695515|nr:Mu transposase C-terminal domain-containing protein [Mycobacteroides abscessus]RIR87692.1 integrase [Mycobacteroides abscessus]
MKSVRLFDCLQFDGASWQVVAQDGTVLSLKNLVTGRIRRLQVTDLLGDDSYLPERSNPLPDLSRSAILETLDPDTRARTEILHRHVVEVLTGVPPVNGDDAVDDVAPKPQYNPGNLLADRVAAKAAELLQAAAPVSERMLWRYLAAYRRDGIAGLVDQRKRRESNPTGRLDPRLVSLLDEAIAAQTNISTGTKSRVIAQVTREATQLGVPVPSRPTLYRALTHLQNTRHPFGNATTRRTQANRPDRPWGRQAPTRPGELVEIDSTPLDLMVLYPDGSAGRVDLTVALDIATRTPCAAILRPVATKAVDAALLLARALTPLHTQPGWTGAVAFSRSILPAGMIADDDAIHGALASKPVIVPESVTVDRGKVYIGSTFLNACERLQINVTKAAPRTPTDKPHIERVFAAINSGFTQYLAGYTGPNVVRRGKSTDSEAFWTMAEVQNLLDLWIATYWQNKPHPGLRHPAMPKKDLTPNEAYAALAAVAPTPQIALTRDDYIALLPLSYRGIQHYGINFEDLRYDSPQLWPLRGTNSGLPEPARGRWEIRYDPFRMQSIYLRDHREGRWIEAEWSLAKQTLAPFSLDMLRAARRAIHTRGEALTAIDILGEINRIQTAGPRTPRERSASRRDATNSPSVPALTLIRDPDTAPERPAADTGTPVTATHTRKPKAARRIDDDEEF